MARKKRDYKAEYAASKRRARAAGYRSPREYQKARKALKLPPRTSPVPRRILERNPEASGGFISDVMSRLRREARLWSGRHSNVPNSAYSPDMTDEQVRKYHYAFVEPIDKSAYSRRGIGKEKRKRIKDYLVPDKISEKEWDQIYRPT